MARIAYHMSTANPPSSAETADRFKSTGRGRTGEMLASILVSARLGSILETRAAVARCAATQRAIGAQPNADLTALEAES
jgi:hypothetical protein